MMRTTKTTGLMLATGLATFTFLQPATALEAQAFIDRMTAVYGSVGYDMEFGPATADGDTITVEGVTISLAGMPEEDTMVVDTTLTFTGVVENEDGSITAEQMTVPDIDTEFASEPVGRLTWSDIVIEDIYLPAGEATATDLFQLFGRMATGPLSVSRDGTEVISVESMDAASEFTYDDAGELSELTSVLDIAGIWADLTTLGEEDPEAGAVIGALGLTEVNGTISQTMRWTMGDGNMVIDEFLFDFDDLGALDIKADITGFTPAVMDKIYAMQIPSDLDPTSEEAQAQQMMLGMELLQALSITSASIRYDDASLANKLIDLFAAQSGADRAQFIEGLKAMAPQMVSQAGVPALTDMVVPAINAFLDNPQSFEVAVRPPNPTTLLVLSAAAANPAGLISALGLAVTANQPAQ